MAAPATLSVESQRLEHAKGAVLTLVLLSCGHAVVDLYSSAIGALQPMLADKLHLSLTQAGILAGTFVFSNSVTQPLYGYLADRFHTRMFAALAPAVAGIFVSSVGRAPTLGGRWRWRYSAARASRRFIRRVRPIPSRDSRARNRRAWPCSSARDLWVWRSARAFFRMSPHIGDSRTWCGSDCSAWR